MIHVCHIVFDLLVDCYTLYLYVSKLVVKAFMHCYTLYLYVYMSVGLLIHCALSMWCLFEYALLLLRCECTVVSLQLWI